MMVMALPPPALKVSEVSSLTVCVPGIVCTGRTIAILNRDGHGIDIGPNATGAGVT